MGKKNDLRVCFSEVVRVVSGRGNNRKVYRYGEFDFTNADPNKEPISMLPPGDWPHKEGDCDGGDPTEEFEIPERFQFLRGLGPAREIVGITVGRRFDYRGFIIAGKAIVENPGYGNAVYIFHANSDWEEVIQESKLDIIKKRPACFVGRIYHRNAWKSKLLGVIKNKFQPRPAVFKAC